LRHYKKNICQFGQQLGLISCQFLPQMAAWFPEMLCNFYLVKNYKIANNLVTTEEATGKISTYLESLYF
jgi:hypothetical protein